MVAPRSAQPYWVSQPDGAMTMAGFGAECKLMALDDSLSAMTRVFVYGTLKPGGQYHDEYCSEYLVEAVAAIAPGQLYDFPHLGYPGMTVGDGWVHGYLLSFSSVAILEKLDWLEDYDLKSDPAHNEYQRQQIEVFTPAGNTLGQAWIYSMTSERVASQGGVRLEQGSWLETGSNDSDPPI